VYDKSPKLNDNPVKWQAATAATRRNNVLLLDCYTTQSHSLPTFFRTSFCFHFQCRREAASFPATQVMSTDCMASYSSDTIPRTPTLALRINSQFLYHECSTFSLR